ncbi:MAG: SDR family oxidoreductase [Gammaproteobacteria bacterium]|jgi:NAD(P)-dependent dehydrogenase (short-subunit alcohol dehydrogenase family)
MDIPSDWGLEDTVAIVCGGGAEGDGIGNGRAAAILLAQAGARVLVVDRQGDRAARTAEIIEDNSGTAAYMAADVTDESDCEAVAARALRLWGRLDILDNNVGIGSRGSVVEETRERWEHVMEVNVTSMFLMSKFAVPAMIESADGGAIINVSSISALRPRGLTTYSVSKGAVIALTKAMAVDHGPAGIRVNCVVPGPMYTPMVYAGGMSEEARANRRSASVLGIEGTGWDVGNAVCFLASPRARYITGQALVVDGGVTLRGPERDSR